MYIYKTLIYSILKTITKISPISNFVIVKLKLFLCISLYLSVNTMKKKLNESPCGFIKAVSNEYANKYFYKGEIFFNTLSYYQKLEREDDNIGDSGENPFCYYSEAYAYISKNIDVSISKAMDIKSYECGFKVNDLILSSINNKNVIHSLYNVKELDYDQEKSLGSNQKNLFKIYIDPKFHEEYKNTSRFFYIYEPQVYLDRIITQLEKNGLKLSRHYQVEYLDSKHEFVQLTADPFKKRNKYSYQNEYRLLVEKTGIGPLTIHINSLQDIAYEVQL